MNTIGCWNDIADEIEYLEYLEWLETYGKETQCQNQN